MDNAINQMFFSDNSEPFSSDHPMSEVPALMFYLLVKTLDDKLGDVMLRRKDNGVTFFVWRPPTLSMPSGSVIGLRFPNCDDFGRFFSFFKHWISSKQFSLHVGDDKHLSAPY